MSNKLKYLFLAFILIISIGLRGQEEKSPLLTYSLSYIQPTLLSFQGEFEFVPIYLNFEANVHYKPYKFISFSSGLGYHRNGNSMILNYSSSTVDNSPYQELFISGLRLPLQVNFHFPENPLKTDFYLKTVYTNGLAIRRTIWHENNSVTEPNLNSFYDPSMGIGVGSTFLKNRRVGIIIEGMVEKYLRFDSFKDATWYSLKIGIVI